MAGPRARCSCPALLLVPASRRVRVGCAAWNRPPAPPVIAPCAHPTLAPRPVARSPHAPRRHPPRRVRRVRPRADATPPPTPPVATPERRSPPSRRRRPCSTTSGRSGQDVVGQDHWWEALPLDGSTPPTGWTVRFTAGWGDCPAGCIDQHSWTWNVTSEATVTFVSEEGSVLTPEVLAGLHANAKGPGAGGRVTAGPTCPVERPGDPACAPRMVAGAVAGRPRRRGQGGRARHHGRERPLPVQPGARRLHAGAPARRGPHGDRRSRCRSPSPTGRHLARRRPTTPASAERLTAARATRSCVRPQPPGTSRPLVLPGLGYARAHRFKGW